MRLLALALSSFSLVALAHAASFDCATARTATEKIICTDQNLSRLDEVLNKQFQQAIRLGQGADAVRKDQEVWLQVRDTCADAECIQLAYEARLLSLRQKASARQWIPDTFWMTERQRADAVRAMLLASSPRLRLGSYENDPDHFKFCTTFLNDFEQNKGVEYIEPMLRATDYDNSRLMKLRGQCASVHWEWSAPAKCNVEALASWLKGFEGDERGALRKANEMCATLFGKDELALYEVGADQGKQYVIYQSRTPSIDTAALEGLLRTPTKKELWVDQSAVVRKMNTVVNVFFALSGYSVIDVGDGACKPGANLATLGFTSPESHQGLVRYGSQYIAYNLVRSSKRENDLTFAVGGHHRVCYFDLRGPESIRPTK